MGNLEHDTAVTPADGAGRYTATLSRDWEIWGPMGGYVASIALRAAAAESPFARPASFFCQYLGVGDFDQPLELAVTPLRSAKTALAQRVEVRQGERSILEATVWSVGDVEGLEHDLTSAVRPDVPAASDLRDLVDWLTDEEREQGPPFSFWNNLDTRPIEFTRERPDDPKPEWREWLRFAPQATFDDPWVDACRALIVVDVQSWPSAGRAHVQPHGYIAPSLDLYVAFHDPRPSSAWLLADGAGPVARDGLMAWNGRMWSEDGALVASGTGQLLCRRVGPRS